ncbi:cytochrome P450 [Xylaria arbuscula]|nr:cytochrome P450 [Xylaria arbuscula]
MPSTTSFLSLVLLGLVCGRLLINWLHLKKAPGPAIAGATDLWRAYQQYKGRLRGKISDLHAQYGPVVRYGVRSISINDSEVVTVVYGSRAGFITADSYNVLVGIQNGKEVSSLISTRDESRHAALRRSVANAFTPTASLDYENAIDATTRELIVKIDTKTRFDLSSMILWYTVDVAGRFSFGEPVGCLAGEDDVSGSIQLIRDRFNHWGWWSSIPGLERLIFRNPIAMRQKRAPSSMAALALSKLKARSFQAGHIDTKENPDLLTKFLDAREHHPDILDTTGIVGMLMSTITAAGDTTATAITVALYHLLRNPEYLKKLEDELTGLPEIPAYSDLSKLPYLNAVVKEALRIFPVSNWPIERLVPAGGVTIAGMFFPEGTSVGCLPSVLHQNKHIYGEDARLFRPDRWLISDREQLRRLEAAHMGFSRGRRVCLGQHIAVIQMKKVIATIVIKYKLSLLHPEAELGADFSSAVACLEPLHVLSQIKQ